MNPTIVTESMPDSVRSLPANEREHLALSELQHVRASAGIRRGILLIHGPDQKGIVAKISGLLYAHSANIVNADHHVDQEAGVVFMRVEWTLENFEIDGFQREFEQLSEKLNLRWRLHFSEGRPAVAIFVSKYLHCLSDLLHRREIGELPCSIPLIISNHTDAEPLARFYNVPFHHIPTTAANRVDAEVAQHELLERNKIDLIVLARYMQVLSSDFVACYQERIINVHHSILPAFSGARPYHRAFERGVKMIGATSHYVTKVLDEGPIIEQDIVRMSHRDRIGDLIEKGRDLERVVLSRAVRWHLDGKILAYANKTVVFD
jgi:formyltetrahydrofolate deformylase